MKTETKPDSCAWMLDARADILTDRGVDSDDPRLMRMASAEIAALSQENARLREALAECAERCDEIGVGDQAPGHVNYLSKLAMARAARALASDIRTALRAGGAEKGVGT